MNGIGKKSDRFCWPLGKSWGCTVTHCTIWLFIFTFALPLPVMSASAGDSNVLRRLNSPERAQTYAFDLTGVIINTTTGALGGTIRVTDSSNGAPISGVSVTLLYKTHGGFGTAQATSVNLSGTTDNNGDLTVSGNVNLTPRKIVIAASVGSSSSSYSATQYTIGTLTSGFLTGPSLDDSGGATVMDWVTARQYCANHGGKLPKIQNADALTFEEVTSPGGSVDGFGALGDPWPGAPFPPYSGSGADGFWTDTLDGDDPDISWVVFEDGKVLSGSIEQGFDLRVACVP